MKFFKSKGPFISSKNTTNNIMTHLLISLIPIIIFSFYKNGIIPYINNTTGIYGLFLPLIVIFLSIITSFVTEFLFFKFCRKSKTIKEDLGKSFAIFPGLFVSLILPLNTPLYLVLLASFVASFSKVIYGGFGKNLFNPALIGRLFVVSAYAMVLSNAYLNSYEIDTLSSATPLSNIAVVDAITYDNIVKPYGTLTDFFFGTIPGTIGETSTLLILAAFVYLVIKKVIKPIIPITYILTFGLISLLACYINGIGQWYTLFQLFSGGLFFGAVFMATDPVTSPTTKKGQLIYGMFLGILTAYFRFLTPYPEGVLTSILTLNLFARFFDNIFINKKVIYLIYLIPICLIFSLPFLIELNGELNVQTDFNIISKTVEQNITTYEVSQKGFSGHIYATIIIDEEILSIEVTSQSDSYYQKIIDSNFIEDLTNDVNVDTVSGATVTSTALKKMVSNTLEDYGVIIEAEEDIEKEAIDGGYIYTINTYGFSSEITLNVTIVSSVVKSVEVISCNDSYYYMLEESNYLNNYINAPEVVDIDTVSGATITSSAIKNSVIDALEDYRS